MLKNLQSTHNEDKTSPGQYWFSFDLTHQDWHVPFMSAALSLSCWLRRRTKHQSCMIQSIHSKAVLSVLCNSSSFSGTLQSPELSEAYSRQFCKYDQLFCHTYKQFALVNVLAPSTRVLYFFTENQGHLKKEKVPLSSFSNQSFWVPHLEGFLKDKLSLRFYIFIKA